MNLFGLIGKNIAYSNSQNFFDKKFKEEGIKNCVYRIFDLNDINEVNQLFGNSDLKGFNVTIPYKQQILSFLDELSPEAKDTSAVNCVTIDKGVKTGHNTDVYGFELSLHDFLDDFSVNALVLGDGGAAQAVCYVLRKLGIHYQSVSRKGNLTFADLTSNHITQHRLIINCTPLGVYPDTKLKPEIPYQALSPKHYLYDLIYNPVETTFMKLGKQQGAKTKNGMQMLKLQAEKSWEIWSALL